MKRSGDRAHRSELVPIHADHSELLMLEFGADGRLLHFAVVRQNLAHETPDATAARLLVEQLAAKLRRASGLAELRDRARLALDLVENLIALEEMHGDAARQLLAPAPAGSR